MNSETQPTAMPEELSREREAELVTAAARLFRTGFPNPERVGCPAREALLDLARKGRGPDESRDVIDHLTCCSQCFGEYEQFVRRERLASRMRLLALCASVLIAVGLAVWFYAFRGGGIPAPTVEVATVDLRGQVRLRGGQIPELTPPEGAIPVVPVQRLKLSIILPVGSEEGQYEVQIRGQEETPRFVGQGEAVFQNQTVVLPIEVDLQGIEPGEYFLGIRRPEFRWAYYFLRIQ